MNWRFTGAIVIAIASVGFLIWSAVVESKKEVVTVSKLIQTGGTTKSVRLGARVADVPFEYQTTPELLLRFTVRDRERNDLLPVVYHGPMPETLKVGRDVIVEGRYEKGQFHAELLQTQCPSKYEPPPVPAAGS